MRATQLATVGLVMLALSSAADAQTPDAVVVLYHGGVRGVEVFDLSASEPREATRLGERPVVPSSLGLVRISDIKILPDGSHLLSNVDGRGSVVTSPDGSEVKWELDPLKRLPGVDCSTVGSYFAAGEPSLVLSGDSASSNVTLRSTSQNSTIWFDTLRLTSSRGSIAQVAVMPQNLVAMAVNWSDAGIYGIRIRDTSDLASLPREILNRTHAEAPSDAVIVPQLDVIRELMVLADGRMLVTTRYAMVILAADGTLDELVDIGMLPGVAGELASVRVLPSGLWALASFEPGQWIQPHINHRLHWYDPETGEIVASSPPLSRAPVRVEAQAGMGGTNTVGFDGGLDLIQQGDPTAIEVVSLVVPPSRRIGEFISVRGTVQNTGQLPVGLANLAIRAASGPCGPNPVPEIELAVATSVALNPGAQFSWIGDLWLDASVPLGPWCAFVQGRDQQGVLRTYGDAVEFELLESSGGSGSTIVVRPLPFNVGPEDMGADASDASDVGDIPPDDKGCCATVAHKRSPLPEGVMLIMAALWARGRARR